MIVNATMLWQCLPYFFHVSFDGSNTYILVFDKYVYAIAMANKPERFKNKLLSMYYVNFSLLNKRKLTRNLLIGHAIKKSVYQ